MIKHPIPQQSPAWLQLKKGKISGTQLKGLMGTPKARQEALYDIIGERLKVGIDDEYEHPIDRGNRLEPFAVAAYEMEMGTAVDRTGFCQKDGEDHVGNSPDGLIGETGALEIKCPEHKNHIKYWLTNEIPDDYIWQVVQYFVVNEKLEWCDFVSYNPDIPVHPLHIIRVTREELADKIAEAESKEKVFLDEVNSILSGIIEF